MVNEMLQGIVPKFNKEFIHPYYENSSFNSSDYLNVGNITLTSMDDNYNDGDKIICFNALTTEELLHSTYSSSSFEFEKTEFSDVFKFIIDEKNENLKYINDYMYKNGMHNNTIYF